MGFWLFMAVWLSSTDSSAYNTAAKYGPFQHLTSCYAYGVIIAEMIQTTNTTNTAVGACIAADRDPVPVEYKNMWEMVCASLDKPDSCAISGSQFVNPYQ